MKKTVIAGLIVVMVLSLVVAFAGNGNNAPSGPHYNLNIVGVSKDKNVNMDQASGHVIFVDLNGKSRILLAEGDDFAVLDKNGTDGEASFQLPNPDPENTGTSGYSVFARALGKPGGKADMTTGAYQWIDDNLNGQVDEGELYQVLSVITLKLSRTNGKQVFENVTRYLLYIYVDLDGDGTAERYPLFDDALQDYFWDYDNNGLKLCQLRFYPGVATEVPDSYPVPQP